MVESAPVVREPFLVGRVAAGDRSGGGPPPGRCGCAADGGWEQQGASSDDGVRFVDKLVGSAEMGEVSGGRQRRRGREL